MPPRTHTNNYPAAALNLARNSHTKIEGFGWMVSWHRQPFERKPEINFRAPFVYAILFFSALQRKNITKQNKTTTTTTLNCTPVKTKKKRPTAFGKNHSTALGAAIIRFFHPLFIFLFIFPSFMVLICLACAMGEEGGGSCVKALAAGFCFHTAFDVLCKRRKRMAVRFPNEGTSK